jgi:hypothetical protein
MDTTSYLLRAVYHKTQDLNVESWFNTRHYNSLQKSSNVEIQPTYRISTRS